MNNTCLGFYVLSDNDISFGSYLKDSVGCEYEMTASWILLNGENHCKMTAFTDALLLLKSGAFAKLLEELSKYKNVTVDNFKHALLKSGFVDLTNVKY